MRISKKITLALTLALFSSPWTQAAEEGLHWGGDDTFWPRKENVVELTGNAYINQSGEFLKADKIILNLNTRNIHAMKNVRYVSNDLQIIADEMKFNLDTRVGSIIGGRVTNGKFLLLGDRINRLSTTKFQTHRGEYTTCIDCPGSWSMRGLDVDLELGGYAFMNQVTVQIKDNSIFWLPYLVIPIKTQRQSGFLFPRFGYSVEDGFRFLPRFFWATSRSTDMTIGLGRYTERGERVEWEGRYQLTKGNGVARFFFQRDQSQFAPSSSSGRQKVNRWAGTFEQQHTLPWDISERFNYRDVSDIRFPIDFSTDIIGRNDPVLNSELSLAKLTRDFQLYTLFRKSRSLLNFEDPTAFDRSTVQLEPRVGISLLDRSILESPFIMGFDFEFNRYNRSHSFYDLDAGASTERLNYPLFTPGIDPVRKALRYTFTPVIYTTARVGEVVSVVPSLSYKNYFYDFHGTLKPLLRSYVHFKTDLSFQLEKIYDLTDSPRMPRLKHIIRPMLTYSVIPQQLINENQSHPFLRQYKRDKRETYVFDNDDIVPMGNPISLINYATPQGHSIEYGFTTKVISRNEKEDSISPTYATNFELSIGQALNFLELRKKPEQNPVPLSRAYALQTLSFDEFQWHTQYYFYPYLSKLLPQLDSRTLSPHQVSSSFSWIWEKAKEGSLYSFERSISAGFGYKKLESKTFGANVTLTYSISDYFLPQVGVGYDFLNASFNSLFSKFIIQNPSRCWRLIIPLSYKFDGATTGKYLDYGFNFEINLTGEGYAPLDDAAQPYIKQN